MGAGCRAVRARARARSDDPPPARRRPGSRGRSGRSGRSGRTQRRSCTAGAAARGVVASTARVGRARCAPRGAAAHLGHDAAGVLAQRVGPLGGGLGALGRGRWRHGGRGRRGGVGVDLRALCGGWLWVYGFREIAHSACAGRLGAAARGLRRGGAGRAGGRLRHRRTPQPRRPVGCEGGPRRERANAGPPRRPPGASRPPPRRDRQRRRVRRPSGTGAGRRGLWRGRGAPADDQAAERCAPGSAAAGGRGQGAVKPGRGAAVCRGRRVAAARGGAGSSGAPSRARRRRRSERGGSAGGALGTGRGQPGAARRRGGARRGSHGRRHGTRVQNHPAPSAAARLHPACFLHLSRPRRTPHSPPIGREPDTATQARPPAPPRPLRATPSRREGCQKPNQSGAAPASPRPAAPGRHAQHARSARRRGAAGPRALSVAACAERGAGVRAAGAAPRPPAPAPMELHPLPPEEPGRHRVRVAEGAPPAALGRSAATGIADDRVSREHVRVACEAGPPLRLVVAALKKKAYVVRGGGGGGGGVGDGGGGSGTVTKLEPGATAEVRGRRRRRRRQRRRRRRRRRSRGLPPAWPIHGCPSRSRGVAPHWHRHRPQTRLQTNVANTPTANTPTATPQTPQLLPDDCLYLLKESGQLRCGFRAAAAPPPPPPQPPLSSPGSTPSPSPGVSPAHASAAPRPPPTRRPLALDVGGAAAPAGPCTPPRPPSDAALAWAAAPQPKPRPGLFGGLRLVVWDEHHTSKLVMMVAQKGASVEPFITRGVTHVLARLAGARVYSGGGGAGATCQQQRPSTRPACLPLARLTPGILLPARLALPPGLT
jgi:hypothetical protein